MTRKQIGGSLFAARSPHDVLALIAGIVLFFAPLVAEFGEAGTAVWTAHIVGAVLIAVSAKMLLATADWNKWAYIVLGLATFLAPWVLGFSTVAVASWTHVIVGLAVGAVGIWRLFGPREAETPDQIGPDARST
ncbi:SPW repeat protein (plasmid) [Skermanella rosea]|uniref:SPW repeat protein n=1 Tax=Skermanella rosea TaxID=1817965 RepID=UPI00193196A6|nr:SPW repeat protein [Skermanella rosea]UEM07454.1 SPW repeat protein [Skermanella rosea]